MTIKLQLQSKFHAPRKLLPFHAPRKLLPFHAPRKRLPYLTTQCGRLWKILLVVFCLIWSKANLPSSLGRLNLQSAVLHAPPTLINSIAESPKLVSLILGDTPVTASLLSSAISYLAKSSQLPSSGSLEHINMPFHEKSPSCLINVVCFNTLVHFAPDVRSRALALSSSLPHAGDWLNVIPCPARGLCILDQEFRLCLNYWVGLSMSKEVISCPLCGKSADRFGDHQVGCGDNGDQIHRHDSLRDVLFSASHSAALAP